VGLSLFLFPFLRVRRRSVSSSSIQWSVFTKPWPHLSMGEVADLVAGMGFDAVEFPLRPGFQIDLDDLPTSAVRASSILADAGLAIASVASTPSVPVFGTCAELGIPVIRIMAPIAAAGYAASDEELRRYLDSLVPSCERYGVRVGIQPHIDDYIADSLELANLLTDYDPAHICAVWDSAHDALARKPPRHTLGALWSHLAVVNFKNACYEPAGRHADGSQIWNTVFVPGPDGLGDWSEAADTLVDGGYAGTICMAAEFTDDTDLEAKVIRDFAYLQSLLAARASA
jgi:sugar phosphate isomerase/epimerase